MNFPLSVSPSKEMGDRTRQRKKSPTSAGIEPLTFGFDRPIFFFTSCDLPFPYKGYGLVGIHGLIHLRSSILCP